MITRSEAIRQLRLLKADITNGLSFVSKTKDKHPALDSLDMAIKSLETDEAYQLEYEQPEFCVNCVSRKDVNNILKNHWLSGTASHRIIDEIAQDIHRLPSVLPKADARRKGHWDKEGACPFCDYLRHWRDDNYCAHCGADLRKDG